MVQWHLLSWQGVGPGSRRMSLSPTWAAASPWHDGSHCLFLEDRVLRAWNHHLGCAASPNWQSPYMGLGPGLEDCKWLWLQSRVNSTFSLGWWFSLPWQQVNESRRGWNWCPVQDKAIAGLVLMIWPECQAFLSFCLLWWDWKQARLHILQSIVLVSYDPWINSICFQISLEFCLSGARPQGCHRA